MNIQIQTKAEIFAKNVIAQYKGINAKAQVISKVVTVKLVLLNGDVVIINSINFEPPETIVCQIHHDNKDIDFLLIHYTQCQIIMSIHDNEPEESNKEKPNIGFATNLE